MKLGKDQVRQYEEDGFLLIEGLFDAAEMALLRDECTRLGTKKRGHPDANVYDKQGGNIQISYALELDSEACDAAYRLPRLVGPAKQMLGDSIFLWQTRVVHKVARRGEMWKWHQDFTTWAMDGARRSSVHDMMTVMVMVDDTNTENGPLRVVRGSHLVAGRKESGVMDWTYDGDTTSYPIHALTAGEEARLFADHPVVDAVGPAGTVLLLSALTVHGSPANTSPNHRRNLYIIYNRLDNRPPDQTSRREVITNPYYLNTRREPFETVPDDTLLRLAEGRGRAA